jgi:hypothetical protein
VAEDVRRLGGEGAPPWSGKSNLRVLRGTSDGRTEGPTPTRGCVGASRTLHVWRTFRCDIEDAEGVLEVEDRSGAGGCAGISTGSFYRLGGVSRSTAIWPRALSSHLCKRGNARLRGRGPRDGVALFWWCPQCSPIFCGPGPGDISTCGATLGCVMGAKRPRPGLISVRAPAAGQRLYLPDLFARLPIDGATTKDIRMHSAL